MTTNELKLKLDQARWWALNNHPFYGQLLFGLSDAIGNPHGKTACTDGTKVFWDSAFLEKLSKEETRFVLLHETLHCAHGHLWRFPAGKVDHNKANQACDHAINLLLASLKDIAMPKGGLCDSQYAGMAEEEIFNALPDAPKSPQGGHQGQGGNNGQDDPCGSFTAPADAGNGQSDSRGQGQPKPGQGNEQGQGAGQDSLKDQWERRVIQAAQAAKASGQGNLPADLSRVLDKVLSQPIDWRREMADFVRDSIASRNDWTRSPRRHAWQPVIYPRRKADDLGLVVFVRDTSGSIDDALAAEFSALIGNCIAETGCGALVIDCDAVIQAEYRLAPGDECPLTAQGGGGTDFAEPFARAKALADEGEKIAGLVYLTDLEGSGQPEEQEIPTLWLCTTSNLAQTGRTIRVL